MDPLSQASETLNALRGAARLARAPESEKLSQQLAQMLSALPARRQGLSVPELKALGLMGSRAVDHLTGLRAALVASGNEAAHLEKSLASLRALALEIAEVLAKKQNGVPS
jgi:hypothetical protein